MNMKLCRKTLPVLAVVLSGFLAIACTESKTTTSIPDSTENVVTTDVTTPSQDSTIPPPTGEPFVIGVVNTEGSPAADFPDFTNAFRAAANYINSELGGFAGRPIELEICISVGSPESSQACAQELAAKKVDLAMIGLDIFVDYGTFNAASIPVIGAVPILPSDYTADAVYITAGNLVVQGSTANAITNPKYLGLKKVAIIANDSPATLSALATLEPALAFAGATAVVIKGGETETDAGYRLLMQQAAATNPEAIVSMYGQSGCVALMRARVELQVEVPAFTNTACLADTVINAVGDAAQGWYFAGSQGGVESADTNLMRQYVSKVVNKAPEDVDVFGFTTLGWIQTLSIWKVAKDLGPSVTGEAITDSFRQGNGTLWGSDAELQCGTVPSLSAVCSFAIPFALYTANGAEPAFGGENVSALDVLDL